MPDCTAAPVEATVSELPWEAAIQGAHQAAASEAVPAVKGWPEAVAEPARPSVQLEYLQAAFLEAYRRFDAATGATDLVVVGEEAAARAEPEYEAARVRMHETLEAVADFQPHNAAELLAKYTFLARAECYLLHDCGLSMIERVQRDAARLRVRVEPLPRPGEVILPAAPHLAGEIKLGELGAALRAAHAAWNAVSHQPDILSVPAGDLHSDAVDAIGAFRPRTLRELHAKLKLLQSPEAEGALDDLRGTAYASDLLDDIARVAIGDEETCPAARLMDEHEPVYAAFQQDMERPFSQPEGPACKANDLLVDRATWVRARSLRGVLYQIAMVVSRLDLIDAAGNTSGVDEEMRRALDHRAIDRLLTSAIEAIREHLGGEPLSNMLDAYCGNTVSKVSNLTDDPPAFDVYAFVRRFEEVGGKLDSYRDVEFEDRIQIVPPKDGGRELLAELGDPIKFLAVQEYVAERHNAVRYFDRVARGLHA